MRTLPLAAALLMLAFPPALAAGSSVELSGPSSIAAEGPTSVDLDVALILDRVACTGIAEIPVELRISETKGLRSSSLSWDRVVFRVAPHAAATTPWRGESQVALRVWAREAQGHAEVHASYVLPSNCVAVGGASSGEARLVVRVEGPAPREEPRYPFAMPPAAPRSESLMQPPPPQESEVETVTLSDLVPDLPGPVLGAILGMCLGGVMVAVKRLRGAKV